MTQHKRFCKSRPPEETPETDVTPQEETPEPTPAEARPVSIPLSVCPRELKYLPQGKLIFLQVAGRMKDGEFVLEDIKMRR